MVCCLPGVVDRFFVHIKLNIKRNKIFSLTLKQTNIKGNEIFSLTMRYTNLKGNKIFALKK